ncbi:E3 SUMO-protein ligase NSE2-like isoform X2 [Ornithodoros turicata]|uniref:E3 SUMO-protein ligase NSE2-like isoform X2 n=1 Tax=Ornithodoros turicata TaxID=34597 RepID=UPI00313A0C90
MPLHCTHFHKHKCSMYTGDEVKECFETLKEYMVSIINIEQDARSLVDATDAVKQQALTDQVTDVQLKNLLSQRFAAVHSTLKDPRQQRSYKDLLQTIEAGDEEASRARRSDADVSLHVSDENRVWKDPITQCNVKMPVKNSICGHIYDKESIGLYMKATRNPRCPFVGCNNRTSLLKTELVDDHYVLRKIQESQKANT